jgi:hypothetical protein
MRIGAVALFVYRWWSTPKWLRFHSYWKLPRLISGNSGSSEAALTGKRTHSELARQWMPVAISLIVLGCALYVILSVNTYADAQQKWAFGVVGSVMGY